MKKIWTPDGLQTGIQLSWVGKGESIINYDQGKATLVDKGKVGVDNQPSSVTPDDDNVIAGNDRDWTNGMKFSDQIAPMTKILEAVNKAERNREKNWNLSSLSKATQAVTDLEKRKLLSLMLEITDRQATQHSIEEDLLRKAEETNLRYRALRGMEMYKRGKDALPKFKKGDEEGSKKKEKSSSEYKYESSVMNIPAGLRAIPSLVGTTAALGKLSWWRRNPIQYHNTYAPNYDKNRALQIMSQNRVSPYPAIRAAQDAERRGNYQLLRQGGLTGAQRYIGRIADTLGNAQNMASIYQDTQSKNATLRNQYAEALAKYGDSEAQRRQQANQHDWDDYIKAHGRKVKGIEQGIADFVSQIKDAYKNEFTYKSWRESAGMYRQLLSDEERRYIATMAAQGYNPDGTPLKKTDPSAVVNTTAIPNADVPSYEGVGTDPSAIYLFYFPGATETPVVDNNTNKPMSNNLVSNKNTTNRFLPVGSIRWINRPWNNNSPYGSQLPYLTQMDNSLYGRQWNNWGMNENLMGPYIIGQYYNDPSKDMWGLTGGVPHRYRRPGEQFTYRNLTPEQQIVQRPSLYWPPLGEKLILGSEGSFKKGKDRKRRNRR